MYNLWFGTEESYLTYLHAVEEVQRLQLAGADAVKAAVQMRGGNSDDPWALPPMWDLQGSTAVVRIQGPLISGKAGFMRLFGVTGYGDIAEALGEVAASKDAKQVILHISSGGGAVAGVEDAGTYIRKLAQVKPVKAYTDDTMASAAYWLGSSADAVFASATAQVGSVGTLIVHTEYSQAYKEAGVQKTLVRYGKYKALGNPYEPLSDDAKEHLQALADESGRIFVEYVADRRGTTPEKFQKTMGEGRVFMGRQALEVGLVDGVMSMEQMLAGAKTLDSGKTRPQNPRYSLEGTSMKIRALTKAVILLLAAGTKVEALGLSSETANVEGVKPEAEDVVALTADATEIGAAFTAATTRAVEAAVATEKAASDKVVADLTAQVETLKAKVTLLEAGASELSAKVNASNEVAGNCQGIVRASIAVMSVALGGSKDVGAALTGKELLAEHDRLSEQFKAKFKAGGVAAVAPLEETQPKAAAAIPPEFLHLLPNRKTA